MSKELEMALGGFNPLKVLHWVLRLARPLVKLNGEQSAAWDTVQQVVELTQIEPPPGEV